MPARPDRPPIPVHRGWLVLLFVGIGLGWAFVGWGVWQQQRAQAEARARLRPRTARTEGVVTALDSLRFTRGGYYFQARYRFTVAGRTVEGFHERKGRPPGLGGVWRPTLRVGGAVTVCYAPEDPAQNGARLYVTASPCPEAP